MTFTVLNARALQERGDAEPPHQIAEPVADEYQADLVQARQIPRRTASHTTYFAFSAPHA